MSPDPPNVNPCQYGFAQERPSGMLIPRTVEAGVSLAPGFRLQHKIWMQFKSPLQYIQ